MTPLGAAAHGTVAGPPAPGELQTDTVRARTATLTRAADAVVAAVQAGTYRYTSEGQLQEGIAEALASAGLDAAREVRLSPRARIDFLAGPVGIEVKIAGQPAAVARQLGRYAASPLVETLVLVTNRARHRSIPRVIGGKPVRVVFLSGVAG